MMFNRLSAVEYENRELAEKIHRVQKLTVGGQKEYEPNEASLTKLLQKILQISKKEKDWFLYFFALGEIMNLFLQCHNYSAIVKYAEVFYKDSDLYMNREAFYHKGNDEGWIITYIYDNIFTAYRAYHQIDDDKINTFMKRYEEISFMYGDIWRYYDAEMKLGTLYWDIDLTEHGKRLLEKYEREINVCYFCSHREYARYYLMKGQLDLAEEYMLTAIQKQPPKPYWSCDKHGATYQYGCMLWDCLDQGKPEAFRYFYEKYWIKQPEEIRRNRPFKCTQDAYCAAIEGCFASLEKVLQLAKEDVENTVKYGTRNSMYDSLAWWCYFRLLDRSGVHEVTIELTEVSQDEKGKVFCLALSDFFEQRADDYGIKFEQARKKFDYRKRKEVFWECAGL